MRASAGDWTCCGFHDAKAGGGQELSQETAEAGLHRGPSVAGMRKMDQHDVMLGHGLARGRIGWWWRRAERRLRDGNFKLGLLEAWVFDVYNRVERTLFPRQELSRSRGEPGREIGTAGNKASESAKAMTDATAG